MAELQYADGPVAWYEDPNLRRKALVGFAGLAFLLKSVVVLIKTGSYGDITVEEVVNAVFGLGMLVDVTISVFYRLRRGKDARDPIAKVIPAFTPKGVEEFRAAE